MVNYGRVKSSIKPKAIEINPSMVFISSNIKPYVENFDGHIVEGYEYNYQAYTKDEYIEMIGSQNNDLQTQLLETQMALCEIYESLGGDI